MSLNKFEEWILENKPNQEQTLELIQEYIIYRNAPLKQLKQDCPWIEDKERSMDSDRPYFTKLQIKELLDKNYTIEVSQYLNKDNHYQYDFMPFEYSIDVTIFKDDKKVLAFYAEDTESFDYILTNFYEFKGEGVAIYDES